MRETTPRSFVLVLLQHKKGGTLKWCHVKKEQNRNTQTVTKKLMDATERRHAGENRASRSHVFTVNIPEMGAYLGRDELDIACETMLQDPGYRYMCAGQEVAPTTGTRHYQGYIHWGRTVRFKQAKKVLGECFKGTGCTSVFVQPARGTAEKSRTYCSKCDTDTPNEVFVEYGKLPDKQGSRTDLALVVQAVASGKSLEHIAMNHSDAFLKYSRSLQTLQNLTCSKPRDSAVVPTVYWLQGRTGVGKSRWAYETFGHEAYWKMNDKWWDGYTGQKVVIFDDYRPSLCTYAELLRILDRYPHRVQPKGGSMELSATTFVITTTDRPEVMWHSRTGEQMDQLLRRLTVIKEILMDGEIVLKDEKTPYVHWTKQEVRDYIALTHPQEAPHMF